MGPPFQGAQGTPWAGLGDLGDQGTLFGVLRVPLRVCGVSGGITGPPFGMLSVLFRMWGVSGQSGTPIWGPQGAPWGSLGYLGDQRALSGCFECPPGILGLLHGIHWVPGILDLWGAHMIKVRIWDVSGAHLGCFGCPFGMSGVPT